MKKKKMTKSKETLEYLEKNRKILKDNHTKLLIIISILSIILSIIFKDLKIGIILAICIFAYIGDSFLNQYTKEYSKNYKNFFISKIFEKMFQNVTYQSEEKINNKIFSIKLFTKNITEIITNDHINAQHKNVSFDFADIRIYHNDDPFIFMGQWYVFDFHKHFKEDVTIISKKYYDKNKEKLTIENLNIVEVEDVEFNEIFTILTKKDINAFYALTPQIIEKIKLLEKKTKGNLLLNFTKNKLHIGLNTCTDKFEPNIYKENDIPKIENQTIKEITTIIDLIETLDLNKNIFRKED